MKRFIIAALLLVSSQAMAAPENLFKKCTDAFVTAPFSKLKNLLDVDAPIKTPDECMRLSNREFVVTGNPLGPYDGDPSNFFYCRVEGVESKCEVDNPSNYYPNVDLLREFSGPKGKQYALWKTQLLRRGLWGTGYQIVSLVPKSRSLRGYEIYSLSIGTSCNTSDGESECCRGSVEETIDDITVMDPRIANEGKASVSLVFETIEYDCRQAKLTTKMVTYVLKHGRFVPK